MRTDDQAEFEMRPMEPSAPKPRQGRLPIDAPKPELGQPIDSPRPRKRQTAGEQPLLPVLHDMAGIGSTDITPFLTVKPCVETVKSHLSKAVVDPGWERQVAHALDESSRVHAWVKNQGRRHEFIPDFVVALRNPRGEPSDDHLVVEVKGLEREADRSKDVGAQRWIAAVNHWGKLGRWRYAKIHSPHDLISVLNSDPGPS